MPADPRTVLAAWCREERAKLDAATAKRVYLSIGHGRDCIWIDIEDDAGEEIVNFAPELHPGWALHPKDVENHIERVKQNAALIVSAVNAHAALVSFVEQALSSGCECSTCLNGGRPYCEVEMQHMERLATLARSLGLLEEGK